LFERTDRNLILVDTRVVEYEQVVAAVNANTLAITYDAAVDTYASLLEKIAVLNVPSIASIAIAQHGSAYIPVYKILDSDNARVAGVETEDPELTSWAPIAAYFETLVATYQVKTGERLGGALLYQQRYCLRTDAAGGSAGEGGVPRRPITQVMWRWRQTGRWRATMWM